MHDAVERNFALPSFAALSHIATDQGIRNEWWAITSVSSCPYWHASM